MTDFSGSDEAARAKVWRRDVVEVALQRARAALAGRPALEARELGSLKLRARRRASHEGELERFAWSFAALEVAARELDIEGARAMHAEAARCLRRVGIGRRGSRLSDLHAALEEELARAASPSELFDVGAEVRLRLLERGLAGDGGKGPLERLGISGARVLRLGGRFDEAARWLDEHASAATPDSARWERAAITAMRIGDPDALVRALRTGEVARDGERLLELWLWTRAAWSKAHLASVPAASSLRRSYPKASEPAAWEVALVLERAYKSELPLAARVASVTRALARVDELGEPALLLLSVGALARWAARFKQADLARRAAAQYEALSLSASDGAARDVFGLSLGKEAVATETVALKDVAPDASLAKLAASLVVARVRAFGAEDRGLEPYVELVAHHLSALKGPAMKLGQIASFYGLPLPEEALRLLASLQDDAAPLPFGVLHPVLEAELGARATEAFAQIDEDALSAGSVGQVHRAVLRSGERVVVKLQYPGMAARIERGLRGLRVVLPLAKRLLPKWDLEGIWLELRERMLLECDYQSEARAQESFHARLSGDPCLVVPRVHTELCTTRVLVTDYFEGETFADFKRTAGEERRSHAASKLVEYAVRTTILDRSFNTDMHPGNLLFEGDKLCLVDFGNVRAWSSERALGWRELLRGLLHDERARVVAALKQLGFVPSGSDAIYGELADLMKRFLMRVLAVDAPVRISKAMLLEEMREMGPAGRLSREGFQIPPELVYAFRMYWGMFAIVADLDAPVHFRRIASEALARNVASHLIS